MNLNPANNQHATNRMAMLFFDVLREYQEKLTEEQRLEFWKELQDGYCQHCGRECISNCPCINDE